MKYIIIGDIHGRTNWKELVSGMNKDTTVIFVGDYTDPYGYEEKISYDDMLNNLNDILNFKDKWKDNVILLFGNHDAQYIGLGGETNRYDFRHSREIMHTFQDDIDLFSGVVYQIGEKYLISHAGVSKKWYKRAFKKEFSGTLSDLCSEINELWDKDKLKFSFGFGADYGDYYGSSSTHGPLWIRETALWENNIFGFESDKIQIVGHTRMVECFGNKDDNGKISILSTDFWEYTGDTETCPYILSKDNKHTCGLVINDFKLKPNIIMVDCLSDYTSCLKIDGDTLEWKIADRDKKVKNNI